jgi:hypothetical protein
MEFEICVFKSHANMSAFLTLGDSQAEFRSQIGSSLKTEFDMPYYFFAAPMYSFKIAPDGESRARQSVGKPCWFDRITRRIAFEFLRIAELFLKVLRELKICWEVISNVGYWTGFMN